MLIKKLILAGVVAIAMVPNVRAQQVDEREAVRQAVLDYVEALYDVAPERIARSVHPELRKLGFHRRGPDEAYRSAPMTYEQLHQLAGRWNTENRQGITPETVKEVVVFDVLDQTASAKLVARWGVDYIHLAKYDGRWQIVNVLWQSPPPGE